MLRKLNKIDLILGVVYSSILVYIIMGFKVLNPNYVDWLAIDDGKAEIGWEFFRNQPLLQFPIGQNSLYGLDLSSSIIFTDAMSMYALILKPFSVFLPERFQYLGIAIFLNFIISFILSVKITSIYVQSRIAKYVYALLILLSPITLHRLIDFTHYGFSSNWIILAAIYLYLKNSNSIRTWTILLVVASLFQFYYLPMILPVFLILMIKNVRLNKGIKIMITRILGVLAVLVIVMYSVGYFLNGSDNLKREGYGEYKSTLLSYIDPNGWSRFLVDVIGLKNNEGFAFLGITQIVLIIFAFFVRYLKNIRSENFGALFLFGIPLYTFSLTNNVALSNSTIFYYEIPSQLAVLMEIFRSTGRFTWFLGYVLIIWSISIVSVIQNKFFSLILSVLLIFQMYDQLPKMMSQKYLRFNYIQTEKAVNPIWDAVSLCYDNIILYPYLPQVDDWYKYAQVSSRNKWGINSVLLARPKFEQAKLYTNELHYQFRTSQFSRKNVYVFSSLDWWSKDFTEREIKNLIRNLSSNDGYGMIDGNFVVYPNLRNCTNEGFNLNFGNDYSSLSTKNVFYFNSSTKDSDYLFENWSEPENWGTWSLGGTSSVLIPTAKPKPELIIIHGQVFSRNSSPKSSTILVEINGQKTNNCILKNNFLSSCSIPIPVESFDVNLKNLYLKFEIEKYDSLNSQAVNDDRDLGFALQKIIFE